MQSLALQNACPDACPDRTYALISLHHVSFRLSVTGIQLQIKLFMHHFKEKYKLPVIQAQRSSTQLCSQFSDNSHGHSSNIEADHMHTGNVAKLVKHLFDLAP